MESCALYSTNLAELVVVQNRIRVRLKNFRIVLAAARAAPSTPRLVSAARVGPVVYGLLLTFRGGGYG